MDNNNIGGMNTQQFSQNTSQTSQPHMGNVRYRTAEDAAGSGAKTA